MEITADWLVAEPTRRVFQALEAVEQDASRFVGGCVRNTLMQRPVDDIDLATKLIPEQTISALEAAGIRAIPTGIEHGTVTAVCDSTPFEITTLRRDVETDGRRAVVAFSRDWAEDAQRRDFRLNALYANGAGTVFDPTGEGISDAQSGRVVFIGDADQRLKEDFLRILRFFRFNAWYGQGIDATGLSACARQAAGLSRIAKERIWREVAKLFSAPNPHGAAAAMDDIGVLAAVLGAEVQSPSRLNKLVVIERQHGFTPDPLLRVMALIPRDTPYTHALADALRLSNRERDRLANWTDGALADLGQEEGTPLLAGLYRFGPQAVFDRAVIAALDHDELPTRHMLSTCDTWQSPDFPIGGEDALAAGFRGPEVGSALKRVEDAWLASGLTLSRSELLNLLRA